MSQEGKGLPPAPVDTASGRSRGAEQGRTSGQQVRGEQQGGFNPAPAQLAESITQDQRPTEEILRTLGENRELNMNVVSAKKKVGEMDEHGNYIKGKEGEEIHEHESKLLARHDMTETPDQYKGGKWKQLKRAIPRWWKHGVNSLGTYVKAKDHGANKLAESGVQAGGLPPDFLAEVRKKAQADIEKAKQDRKTARSGKNRFSRSYDASKDFIRRAGKNQKSLREGELAVLQNLRRAVDGRHTADEATRSFVAANPELVEMYKRVRMGDFQASEALASRMGLEVGGQFVEDALRKDVGEKRSEHAIELKGPMKEFFVNEVVTPLLRNGLQHNGTIDRDMLLAVQTQIQEKFFSKDFAEWREKLPPEMKKQFDLSLSYGTDVVKGIQEVLLPQLNSIKDHLLSGSNLEDYTKNMILNVNVATVQSGEQGDMGENKVEKAFARSVKNEKVQKMYQEILAGREPALPVPDAYLDAASGRINWLRKYGAYSTPIAVNGTLIAAAAIGSYAGHRALGFGASLAAPVVGGSLIAGIIRGYQERARFTREVEQHKIESARGIQFEPDAKRREKMDKLLMPTIDIQSATRPLEIARQQLEAGQVDDTVLNQAFGMLADAKVRRNLMDADRTLELYHKPTERAHADGNLRIESMDAQKTRLELTRAQTIVALREYAAANPNAIADYARRHGISVANGNPVDATLLYLTDRLQSNITQGTEVNASVSSILTTAVTKEQSIEQRQKDEKKARRLAMGKQAAGVAGAGIFGAMLTQEMVAGVQWVGNLTGLTDRTPQATWLERNVFGRDVVLPGHEAFRTDPNTMVNSTIMGHDVKIPAGTQWVEQGNGRFDLVSDALPGRVLIDDAHYVGDKLEYNVDGSYAGGGAVVEGQKINIVDKKVLGPDGLWNEYATPTADRDYYGYDTKKSDFNELKGHTVKRGDDVFIEFQNPGESRQSGLPKADVERLVQEKKLQLAITLPDDLNNPIVLNATDVVQNSKGQWVGAIRLNPNDVDPTSMIALDGNRQIQRGIFSNMFLDREVYDRLPQGDFASEINTEYRKLFRLGGPEGNGRGHISFGRLVDTPQGKKWDSFATMFGTGETPATVPWPEPGKADEIHINIDRRLDPIDNYGIPLVWPRRPLERGVNSTGEPIPPLGPVREVASTTPVTPEPPISPAPPPEPNIPPALGPVREVASTTPVTPEPPISPAPPPEPNIPPAPLGEEGARRRRPDGEQAREQFASTVETSSAPEKPKDRAMTTMLLPEEVYLDGYTPRKEVQDIVQRNLEEAEQLGISQDEAAQKFAEFYNQNRIRVEQGETGTARTGSKISAEEEQLAKDIIAQLLAQSEAEMTPQAQQRAKEMEDAVVYYLLTTGNDNKPVSENDVRYLAQSYLAFQEIDALVDRDDANKGRTFGETVVKDMRRAMRMDYDGPFGMEPSALANFFKRFPRGLFGNQTTVNDFGLRVEDNQLILNGRFVFRGNPFQVNAVKFRVNDDGQLEVDGEPEYDTLNIDPQFRGAVTKHFNTIFSGFGNRLKGALSDQLQEDRTVVGFEAGGDGEFDLLFNEAPKAAPKMPRPAPAQRGEALASEQEISLETLGFRGRLESVGASERGGRPSDEDAYFSASEGFHLGEMGLNYQETVAKLVEALDGLEVKTKDGQVIETFELKASDIETTYRHIQEYIRAGRLKGIDVLADGQGGSSHGEYGSSIATFVFVDKVADLIHSGVEINEEDLREAVLYTDNVLSSYTEKLKSDAIADAQAEGRSLSEGALHKIGAETTFIAQVTDAYGKTYAILGSGDSRIYKEDRDGNVTRVTSDYSLVEDSLKRNAIDLSKTFWSPRKSVVLNSMGSRTVFEENIEIIPMDLKAGDRLYLACDGVWEAMNVSGENRLESRIDSLKEAKADEAEIREAERQLEEIRSNKAKFARYDEQYKEYQDQGMDPLEARNRVFGEVFKDWILGEHRQDESAALAAYLTRPEAGALSGDNVSVVIVDAIDEEQLENDAAVERAEKDHTLADEVVRVKRKFQDELLNGDIADARLFATANGEFVWQNYALGAAPRYGSDNLYRGYCMVEPADIPHVAEILGEIGQERFRENRSSMHFKWLQKKDLSDSDDLGSNPGDYAALKDTDPRIAIYADEPGEIIEILQKLAERPEWRQIEANRLAVSDARRPGTNAFNYNGLEVRSLNFNNYPGYSEDEAADPDWRDVKWGTPTGEFVQSPYAATANFPGDTRITAPPDWDGKGETHHRVDGDRLESAADVDGEKDSQAKFFERVNAELERSGTHLHSMLLSTDAFADILERQRVLFGSDAPFMGMNIDVIDNRVEISSGKRAFANSRKLVDVHKLVLQTNPSDGRIALGPLSHDDLNLSALDDFYKGKFALRTKDLMQEIDQRLVTAFSSGLNERNASWSSDGLVVRNGKLFVVYSRKEEPTAPQNGAPGAGGTSAAGNTGEANGSQLENDMDVADPEGQEKGEAKNGEEWASLIKQKGGGYLSGKFDERWFDPDGQTVPRSAIEDPQYIHRMNPFTNMGLIGKTEGSKIGSGHESADGIESVLGVKTRIYQMDGTKDYNYLSILPPGSYKGIPADGDYQAFTYTMWSHSLWTPDARGHHTPLDFTFYLPAHEANKFLEDIIHGPDLLEEVFQASYPGLTDRGVQRVQAKGFKVVQIHQRERFDYQQEMQYANWLKNDANPYQFSKLIGEQPDNE